MRIEILGIVGALLMLPGCSSDGNHSQLSTGPDANIFTPPPCNPSFTQNDFHHCGECDNHCSIDISDRCIDGECLCGDRPACPSGEGCRLGVCVEPDLDGANCEFDDQCPSGHYCIRAHCTLISCSDEVCDGVDNDCDDMIDENESSTGPMISWCGPADPLPPCRRGHSVCREGGWGSCEGAVLPIPELGWLACDGVDNDCDGCIDGQITPAGICVRRPPSAFDVLYVIDISGSMNAIINRVKVATHTFSSTFVGRPDVHFAIATTGVARTPAVVTDFVEFAEFEMALMGVRANGGGEEPNWDAVTFACDGSLGVSWRDDAVKIIILFTDEPGQSYQTPRLTEADMCGACDLGQVLGFFGSLSHVADFDDCGSFFSLRDFDNLVPNLSSLITDPCGP